MCKIGAITNRQALCMEKEACRGIEIDGAEPRRQNREDRAEKREPRRESRGERAEKTEPRRLS
jgi:hypothetical protein